MKKLMILMAGIFLLANSTFAQVDDRAVIPVAVTLNSILRLNVVSGGNIEFNFNTLADYTTGKANNEAYNTVITVASSVDWEIQMYAEDSKLIGTDNESGINTMDLDNIGYTVTYGGNFIAEEGVDAYDIPAEDLVQPLTHTESTILISRGDIPNAGDINKNKFTINWRCGTMEGGMTGKSILQQSIAPDRYATNVFLILRAL
jgi:hypothetical protein